MTVKNPQTDNNYNELLGTIKQRIRTAQYDALKVVNKELIGLYWDLGSIISGKRKSGDAWGKSVVEKLARDLQAEFPGTSGFSASNLWRMKVFYETYVKHKKLAPLVREISWSHNLVILEKCKDELQREFYIKMSRKFGWSKNVLIYQIENKAYEKTVLGQTNFEKTLSADLRTEASLSLKDDYLFDFLELQEAHSERELEKAILARVESFLREMGGVFAFIGSQYKLEVSGKEYFIDLLLYHRRLKSLVAVELKVGEFMPEYIGKMQFYLSALDDLVREESENPSIGIILCKTKDKTIVEYALRNTTKPIGVSTYTITAKLPKELKGELPAPRQIQKLLEGI